MIQNPAESIPYKKVSSFIAVGIFNTLFNVLVFDVLVFAFKIDTLIANFISLVISIIISYFLNKSLVFKDKRASTTKQLIRFFAGTFVLQLITQHLAVWILGEKYTFFGRVLYSGLHDIGINFSKEFVILNVAKGLGVVFSIAASYVFYDKLVFEKTEE